MEGEVAEGDRVQADAERPGGRLHWVGGVAQFSEEIRVYPEKGSLWLEMRGGGIVVA